MEFASEGEGAFKAAVAVQPAKAMALQPSAPTPNDVDVGASSSAQPPTQTEKCEEQGASRAVSWWRWLFSPDNERRRCWRWLLGPRPSL